MKAKHFWSEQWRGSSTRSFVAWLVSWRTIRRLLTGIAVVVTLTAFFYAAVNWWGHRAWQRHVRWLESRGETVVLTNLAPPAVEERDNLAASPFFHPLFDVRHTEDGVEWNDPQGKSRLEDLKVPRRPGSGNPAACAVGSLAYDCWTDFGACLRSYRELEPSPLELAGDTEVAQLLDYLMRYDDVLNELSEAAQDHPACRFPVEYDDEIPFAILLPHLAPVKNLVGVLSLRAIARLETGQGEAAFEDLQLCQRLSDGIGDEPLLINHLVRLVTLGLDLQVVREGILRGAWTEPQLAALETRLAGIDLLAEARRAFEGERAGAVGSVDYFRRVGMWGGTGELESITGSSGVGMSVFQMMPDGWFYANMLKISELHQEHALGALDLDNRRVDCVRANALDQVVEHLPLRPSTIFVKMFMPAMGRALSRTAQGQTYLDTARIACAIERYRLAGLGLPARLENLVPQFLNRVPTDVIDGQPLRYRVGGPQAYVLYGVGWNRQDDDGSLGWDGEGAKAKLDPRTGDWVWRGESRGSAAGNGRL